jgi:hypothetical protein
MPGCYAFALWICTENNTTMRATTHEHEHKHEQRRSAQ